MKKYVVEKVFQDRFDNGRICEPGELHVPPNEERAEQLISLGFISVVEDKKDETKDKKSSKKAIKSVGEPNGKEATGE